MTLPVPNLDDRTWKQIVDEAVRLIPRYCPEWTNHNSSDPGITLLELYAWMTEMVIYRLNKVPEKNFLTFLDLIGVRLQPPEPAKAVLEFTPAEGTEGELIVRKGTQVATLQAGGGDPVTFETLRDVSLLPVKITRATSSHRTVVADHTAALFAGDAKEALFAGVQEVERFLYVGDDRLTALNEEAAVDLLFEMMPGSSGPSIPSITEWQYFDGKRWREMAINRAESDARRIAFGSHPGIEKQIVNGKETFWVRGKLAEPLKDPTSVQLDSIQLRVEILGEGMAPETAFVNIGNYIFLPVDQGKSFHPFGEEPKFDCALYVGHKELFAAPEARVRIESTLVEPSIVQTPEGSPDLMIFWEYWNGRKWAELGRTGTMGVSGNQGAYNFLDSTGAFTRNGSITFDRPVDMLEVEVGGTKNFWIRARINSGNYGAPGSYEMVGANWVFKEDRPLRPPCLKNLVFKYVREPKPVGFCMSYNDFQYRDHSEDLQTPYVYFQPFLPEQDENPAFYLGFDRKFPQKTIHLYFELDDGEMSGGTQLGGPPPGAAEDDTAKKGPRVVWEYWDGTRFADLLPEDHTFGFTRSGYLDFDGPRDQEKRSVFDTEAFWLRARLESGAYDLPPKLRAAMVNAVDAVNGVTIEEILGSSDGSQDQVFTCANQPLLAGPQVWVLEQDAPSAGDRKQIELDEGFGCIKPDEDGNGTWVRYHEVENFFDSLPGSRHYVLDPIKGDVMFGDGRKGFVPPTGRDSVKIEYKLGGGVAGNVGSNSLTVLKQSVAFVQGVTNPFPASGGADAETIEEAKRRGTYAIKNRDRAITAEDYEQLALAASRRVARAKCVQASDGSISLLLVPKAEREEGEAKAVPSRDLIDRVAAYLDKRRLITARVNVGKPKSVPVSLELTISLKAGATADRVKSDVKDKVKKLLNPLAGGPKGEGWPFGRAVGKADVYPIVEGVEGVDRITDLVIIDEGKRLRVEMLKLQEDELPNLIGVEIYDRGWGDAMAEAKIDALPQISPPLIGLAIGAAKRLAKKRAGATLDIKMVESEEKALTVVKQYPEAGDELNDKRVIKVEIATRPWIQYLPGIYQDADEENADFLQRFLLISQHLTSGIEERLEFLHEFFDSRLTPEKYLPWLASWVAMPLLEGWDEEKRREIIQRVPELYRLRGTAAGLKLYLRLFADVKAEIKEGEWPYPGMVIGKSSTIGFDTTLSAPVFISQCFTVVLPDKKNEVPRERLRTVHALVETEKPAHAHYAVVFEESEPTYEAVPFLHIGKAARIGVDSRIGGLEDVPPVLDEELQKLRLGRQG